MGTRKTAKRGNILLVGNYESDVGYAWWLMENFWAAIARHYAQQGRRSVLVYPRVNEIPEVIQETGIEIHELRFGKDRAALDRLLADAQIGSIYLTDRPYFSLYYRHLRRQSVRKIVLHDHTPGERPAAKGVRRLAKRALYFDHVLCCDLYIGVSQFVRRRMHYSGAIPSTKTAAVLNGTRPQGRNPGYNDYCRVQSVYRQVHWSWLQRAGRPFTRGLISLLTARHRSSTDGA